MGPAPIGGGPLRAGPFLFEACSYRFYADGAYDEVSSNGRAVHYASVWRVKDGTVQIRDTGFKGWTNCLPAVQDAHRRWISEVILK